MGRVRPGLTGRTNAVDFQVMIFDGISRFACQQAFQQREIARIEFDNLMA